jgi:hypothetical protein
MQSYRCYLLALTLEAGIVPDTIADFDTDSDDDV